MLNRANFGRNLPDDVISFFSSGFYSTTVRSVPAESGELSPEPDPRKAESARKICTVHFFVAFFKLSGILF